MVEFLMAGSFFFKDDFQAEKGNETPKIFTNGKPANKPRQIPSKSGGTKISFGEIHI